MKTIVYVLIAGALGAMTRFGVRIFVTDAYNILIVNIIGSFALAIVFDFFREKNILSPQVCGAVGTGFLGAFTTFSAFSYENVSFFMNGHYLHAIVYAIVCLLGGLGAAAFGMWISHKLCERKEAMQ